MIYEGNLAGAGLHFAVVVSRFNQFITDQLLLGAKDGLRRHGVEKEPDVAWVPGTFEMPLVAQKLAESGTYDAVICVGAVIRGGTPHFEYVAGQVASGTARVALDTGVPVIFGVITTDSIEQAIERAGTKAGNKGYEAAVTAIEMAQLTRVLPRAKDK